MVQVATGVDALQKNIESLKAGKIDVIIESKQVMNYTLSTMKMENKLQWAGSVMQAPVYLAFSPRRGSSQELLRQYDLGVRKLKASGELKKIYDQYRLRL